MSKKPLFILLTGVLVAATLAAAGQKDRATINVSRTSPADGKAMYASYCTPCHGADGKGNGRLSSSLKRKATDLTTLSKNNGGIYPADHVVGVLSHGTSTSGHDKAGMPEWAITLGNMDQNNKLDTKLRINNLSKYVETLQTR